MDKIYHLVTVSFKRIIDSNMNLFAQIVFVTFCAIFFIFDLHLYLIYPKATIIKVFRDHAEGNLFVITWFWGILTSHLFIGRCSQKTIQSIPKIQSIVILVLLSIIIYLLGNFVPNGVPQYMQLIFLTL